MVKGFYCPATSINRATPFRAERRGEAAISRGRFAVKTGRGNRKCFGIAFRGDVTGTPGTPIESFSVLFQRFSHFGKPVFCDVSRVSELRELVSGSSARKGVEVQVLSSALVIFGVSRYRGKPRFLWATRRAIHPKKRVYCEHRPRQPIDFAHQAVIESVSACRSRTDQRSLLQLGRSPHFRIHECKLRGQLVAGQRFHQIGVDPS